MNLRCPKCNFDAKNMTSLGTHAAMKHGISGENLYCILNNISQKPTCECGCGTFVTYVSLTKGYKTFVKGHTTQDVAKLRGKAISKAFLKNPELHGSKTDENFGKKVSETRKELVSSGSLKPAENFGEINWNLGLTKETDSRIALAAKKISQTKLTYMSQRLTLDEVKLRIDKIIPRSEILSENYQNKHSIISIVCPTCKKVLSKTFEAWTLSSVCKYCSPQESKAQLEIFNFVSKHCPDAILSDRQQIAPLELDVFVKSKKIAFEYHGLYYHSNAFDRCDSSRHSFKQELCLKNAISLFQIFEDEWREKKSIIQSMILHRLGFSKRIFARNTKVVNLSKDQSTLFFNENHLDGSTQCKQAFGLVVNETIVCALSLRSSLNKNESDFLEIARFANLTNTVVVGGLSKLLKHAKKFAIDNNKKKIITYLDTRLGGTNLYEKVGFTFDGMTVPRFWWTDLKNRFSRQTFKAQLGKTERQVASDAGVYRIYGCKNARFVLCLEAKDENQEN